MSAEPLASSAERFVAHPWVAEGARRPRFGVEMLPLPDWGLTRDFAQTIEGLGFDSLWLPDHPLVTSSAAWVTLAGLAEATRTIRLGSLVSCVYYWHPVALARSAADVDHISGGRAVLGLGSGDMPWEFAQMGLAYPPVRERQATLEEALSIVLPLLRGETVTYAGQHFRVEGARLDPPPLQQPHLPILVAGGGEKTTLRYASQYADASNLGAVSWAGGAFTPDDVRRKFDALDQRCAEAGRPPESVLRSGLLTASLAKSTPAAQAKFAAVPPEIVAFFEHLPVVGTPADAVPRVREMLASGFQYVIFIVMPGDEETLRLLAEQVLPAAVISERFVPLGGDPRERGASYPSPGL